jgi:hypothetical protein
MATNAGYCITLGPYAIGKLEFFTRKWTDLDNTISYFILSKIQLREDSEVLLH